MDFVPPRKSQEATKTVAEYQHHHHQPMGKTQFLPTMKLNTQKAQKMP